MICGHIGMYWHIYRLPLLGAWWTGLCVVKVFESLGLIDCILFPFENRVPFMRWRVASFITIDYRWTTSIKPRLLFPHAGYATRGHTFTTHCHLRKCIVIKTKSFIGQWCFYLVFQNRTCDTTFVAVFWIFSYMFTNPTHYYTSHGLFTIYFCMYYFVTSEGNNSDCLMPVSPSCVQ